ncbi:Tetratricopeptide repeat,Tetratricopeptide repeat-containing domain,Tetratricopeptide-like helical [Cinara cedri]|uniref:Tetratricopeptide repeat,Tetratricopeptide repeat-containing domain,Tetratricopeptide-like helical n=1 Tax=Cinara cedri TaxID=506608 RepID=A0A5E4MQJ6_9HEMI|nr:Tetratricopeptide repeat,Tetratricopeptide repeat-containing domain,Tetratricopeptide-like helical [Cinara cedri]
MDKIPELSGCKQSTSRKTHENHNCFFNDFGNYKNNSLELENKTLIEALKNFRLEPDDNIAKKLADKYKEDGNLYFKSCKYKLAIICYQEGLKLDFQNNELRAQMLNNLSASHFFLKNYRSSLGAAEEALKLKPDYEKTILRAINCCIQLKDFDKSLDYCDKYLGQIPGSEKIEMEKRKMMKIKKLNEIEEQRLLNEINKRKLHVVDQKGDIIEDLAIFNTLVPSIIPPVHLLKNRLVWPVIFLYPEYQTSFTIPEFHEDSTFYSQLVEIFSERPSWDIEDKYNADTVNIYCEFASETSTRVLKIESQSCTLSDALTLLRCPIENGSPRFMIFVAGGQDEKEILEDYVKYVFKDSIASKCKVKGHRSKK